MRSNCCRFCGAELTRTFADLGRSPLANSFLSVEDVSRGEATYPLHVYVCEQCLLVQLQEFERAENIFRDYLYFSSYSELWLRHCRDYAEAMTRRYSLDGRSLVVEIASNDGYLLQYFKERGINILGVEPAANVAKVAQEKGIPSEVAFFGVETARRLAGAGKSADLMAANNVLAHVPNLNDFVGGFKILLKASGTATFEFPHLLNLIAKRQFDTIYHEHFSYLSLLVVDKLFVHHSLRIYDVEESADPRRLTPPIRLPRRRAAPSRQKGGRSSGTGACGGSRSNRNLRQFFRLGSRHQMRLAQLPDRGAQERQVRRWIWRAREREYFAQLLRGRAGVPPVHRGYQPA